MLKFPCNECCVNQYFEFKNILNKYYEYYEQEKNIIIRCCLIIIFYIISF